MGMTTADFFKCPLCGNKSWESDFDGNPDKCSMVDGTEDMEVFIVCTKCKEKYLIMRIYR